MNIKSLAKPSLDWLLVFVPIALFFKLTHGSPTALFITACLAIIPLAGWMGRATEHLAERMGEGIGGLLNATFGNAAELIIALMALKAGLFGVVKASITGSIIGNVLLVMGLSFFAGGLKFSEQKFNRTAARSAVTTLLLAAIALVIPTVFHLVAADVPAAQGGWTPQREQNLSLGIAFVLFATYIATLLFSLKTHKQLFVGESKAQTPSHSSTDADAPDPNAVHATGAGEHEAHWSINKSLGVLFLATAFVALMSEFLVSSIEAARSNLGLKELFVGVIVVAIVGNAAEHSSAVFAAMKNKMDLSIGIAIGSSVQIALFVAPVLIFASYLFGKPMDLEFSIPEISAVIVSVAIAAQIAGDGESNWLEGVQLLAVYLVLGILFFFLPEAAHQASNAASSSGH